jgi:putative ABC transport system permease protein
MITLRLAWRNLLGAGLRTWLNVVVLSFAYLAIIGAQGLLEGMNRQIEQAMIDTEVGAGQLWHPAYDPYDPLSFQDAHGIVPAGLRPRIEAGDAAEELVVQGTLYTRGRAMPVILRGIDPHQQVLHFPSSEMKETDNGPVAIIGSRMARSAGLTTGDIVTLQWRDVHGVFDARDVRIVHIFSTTVQSIDAGQIWLPLANLRDYTRMEGEATFVVFRKGATPPATTGGWLWKSQDDLLADLHEMIRAKSLGSAVVYLILLLLAMLAIFDTQVLSIFRRRKEIGTLMALGMTRGAVIRLFTVEGAMHGVLAALGAALYGGPLLSMLANQGWTLPVNTDSYGFAIGEKLYPVFTLALVLGTTLLVLLATTVVSYLPTRRITTLKPTDALRGRFT